MMRAYNGDIYRTAAAARGRRLHGRLPRERRLLRADQRPNFGAQSALDAILCGIRRRLGLGRALFGNLEAH